MNRRALLVAALAFAAYVALGLAVRHHPPQQPYAIDWLGAQVAGHALKYALIFTKSCLWYALISLGVAVALLGWLVPQFRDRAIFSIVLTLVSWQTSDLMKNLFARERPMWWYLIHEPSYAYSSGHAMFAVVVYGLWGYFFATARLPLTLRLVLAPACFLWALAVIWSRLALGAHWPTDLIGGVLLGITLVALGAGIAPAVAGVFARARLTAQT